LLEPNVPVREKIDEFGAADPDGEKLIAFLKAMEFNTLTKRAAEKFGVAMDSIAAAPDPAEKALPAPNSGRAPKTEPLPDAKALVAVDNAPGAVIDREAWLKPINHDAYEAVTTMARLDHWIARAREAGVVCVDTETTSLDAMQASLCGVSLAVAPNEACYIPCGHRAGDGLDFGANKGEIAQLPEKDVLAKLKPLLEDPTVLKVAQNLKYDYLMLAQRGIFVTPFDDTMLMSYVLDGGKNGHGMDELSELHLSHTPISFSEVAGKGRDKVTFDCVPVKEATRYSAEDADVTLRLHALLKPRLAATGKVTVYETLERALIPVLVEMERAGISVDPDFLRKLSNDFAKTQSGLEKEIHKLAGGEFNIGSPKQLGEILFGKLALMRDAKKTKTGQYATDEATLSALAPKHPIVAEVMTYREASKLLGTYIDALPAYVSPRDQRIHTTFYQLATTTGRLNSQDPNLQNIPIRTEMGREIRRAFVPREGDYTLLSADYSQIELRILAALTQDKGLLEGLTSGEDIHRATAAKVFQIPIADVTKEQRNQAKMVNYGISYGISAFGLAQRLGIPRADAKNLIEGYFAQYPGIRQYMTDTVEHARERGYVETITGRRRYLPDLRSANATVRAAAERNAINMPIQGSSADLIKLAMVQIAKVARDENWKSKMLLQVHDELVFDLYLPEKARVLEVVEGRMKNALPDLKVPIVVETGLGANWLEAH
jgi:DNA polymerase-1